MTADLSASARRAIGYKKLLKRRAAYAALGITNEDYSRMLDEQNGVCAICHSPAPERGRLAVDHNHATGKVRGLLCHSCNYGLGCFKDDPVYLEAAAAYLLC